MEFVPPNQIYEPSRFRPPTVFTTGSFIDLEQNESGNMVVCVTLDGSGGATTKLPSPDHCVLFIEPQHDDTPTAIDAARRVPPHTFASREASTPQVSSSLTGAAKTKGMATSAPQQW
jgi:hypothetical protein